MTDGIRSCRREDFEQITALYQSTFTKSGSNDGGRLQRYLERVYLDSPRPVEGYSSLVSEKAGRVDGYLGIIPHKMQFRGEEITTAVSSALMVAQDPSGYRNPITGIGLLRRYLDGPQDLSFTDTANDITCGLWTALGGSIAHPYCYTWVRPLKPLTTCVDVLRKSGMLRKFIRPVGLCGDSILRHLPPLKPKPVVCEVVEITTEQVLELQQQVKGRDMVPAHDHVSLDWRIQMAEQSEGEGPLAKCVVRSNKGVDLGWFVYYRSRNAVGRVLQLVSIGNAYEVVLDCLLHDASQHGLAALSGRAEPGQNKALTQRYCVFKGAPWVLISSKKTEIIAAFLRGDVLFTGFEGEHWMKTNA